MKDRAIALRKQGLSIGSIEKKLGINRSTLSGWFKTVELTLVQKKELHEQWQQGLVKARVEAAKWHNNEKRKRLEAAQKAAKQTLVSINLSDKNISELALAMLYLGEGIKSNDDTGLGNSDPVVVKTFTELIISLYKIDRSKFRCSLFLRADQDDNELKRFWSKFLNLPLTCFKYVHKDQRTLGSTTFKDYKGVCSVACGNVAIKRKLLNISKAFCAEILARS